MDGSVIVRVVAGVVAVIIAAFIIIRRKRTA